MRFAGKIGYVRTVADEGSVWREEVVEKDKKGYFVRDARRWDKPVEVNDSLTISDEIEIVADSYMLENYAFIKYVVIRGVKWCVNYLDISNRPRIRITLGGVYHGEEADS